MIIKTIDLNVTLPTDHIGMVFMQPFIELSTEREPFCWPNEKKNDQINKIIRTLEISKMATHRRTKSHFTVFPEYSIPGLEGVRAIQEIIEQSDWQKGTIVLAGIDGLNKEEFAHLCEQSQINDIIGKVLNHEWVNCFIGWAKEDDGNIVKWIQPKLVPSTPERTISRINMFKGDCLYLVKTKFNSGVECNFICMICYDWIGRIESASCDKATSGIDAALFELNEHWKDIFRKEINFIFVLQHNDEPDHPHFLEKARDFFQVRHTYQFVNRDNCVIHFINTAGGSVPSNYQSYGHSSLICSPNAPYDIEGCYPTFAFQTTRLRGSRSLGRCKDLLFRERGACITSFSYRLPSFIDPGPDDRTPLAQVAEIYPVDDSFRDPRIPSAPVAASVKWVNDRLDSVTHLLEQDNSHPLRESVQVSHISVTQRLRWMNGDRLRKYIEMSCSETRSDENKRLDIPGRNPPNVDHWNEIEEQSLKMLLHCLSIIGVCFALEIDQSSVHASIQFKDILINIIIVHGHDHDECFEYAKEWHPGSGQRITIIVTNDHADMPWINRFDSILESQSQLTGSMPDTTKPTLLRCGYSNIKHAISAARDRDSLNDALLKVMMI